MKIEIFQGKKNKQWYFHIKSRNGQPIAQSEGYTRKANCIRTVAKITKTSIWKVVFI